MFYFLLAGGDENGAVNLVAAARLRFVQRILFIFDFRSINIKFSADCGKTGAKVIYFWTDYLPPPDSIS